MSGRGKVWQVSKHAFAAIVARSKGVGSILLELGYKGRSGLIVNDLWKRIKEEELSTSHFYTRKTVPNRRYLLCDILVENSTYTDRQALLKRLVAERSFKYECAVCGLPPTWQGNPITLQLDHINGIPADNRIENLRIICPNCHTQTGTFCGKGISNITVKEPRRCKGSQVKKERTCVVCGERFTRKNLGKGLYCSQKCTHIAQRKSERPSKDVLDCLVRSQPLGQVADRFGVSDKALAKWCKQLGVNLPGRGYWAKVTAGKDPSSGPAKCLICGKPASRGKQKYCSHKCYHLALRRT